MGKRKERRFAANNTSRRVKLDLFAEPSGDLGGSDVRCEGVEKEQTEPNELPKSPSSSGKKTDNPLLLLGQYSDEEMEDDTEEKEKADAATVDTSLANKNEQVDGHKDTNIKSSADTTLQMVSQQQTAEDSSTPCFKAEGGSASVTMSNWIASDGQNKQTDPSVQASATVSLEHYAPTDVTSQWKMILHEESNQYYYWNTLTGETSWEVPAVLTQTATAYGTGYNDSGHMVTDAYTLNSGAEPSYLQQPMENMYTGTDSLTAELCERNKSEDHYAKNLGTDVHQVESQIDSAVNYQPCQEELAGPGVSEHVQATVDQGAATDLPSRLLSQSEGLLEKLRSLKKSHGNFHSNEQISKYILELEVRHSDVKALLNDTSPLLPFWLHTEKELKRLEDGVNDEIYELAKSAVMDGIAETDKSSPKEKLVTDETQDSVEEGELAQSGKTLYSDESADASGGNGSPTHSQSNPAEQSDNVTPLDEIQKVGSSVVEDVDMDVDMEVEEPVPLSPAQVLDASGGNQTSPSNLHADVPPPPGEEWVPPPPSEIEDVPPPPPDSFSEPVPPPPLENDHVLPPSDTLGLGVTYTVPQSYIQQPADYAAQYNLSYPEASYQYITNAVAPNTQFYGHVDGSQVSLPQSAYYYETVPGTSEVAPVEAYYNLNSVAPLFPVSAETTLNHGGVGSVNYNIPSDSSKAVEPSSKSNDSAETASLGTAPQPTDGSSQLAKGQSKVKRLKKRTVAATTTSTLRSNKKVSSLVDKWKAAKEELNDSEEEEEEDDYGILDRKRRREIEEWKSRQIASGEAKDNANFQPLGGDWREKVKRRKERAGREGDDEPKKKEDKQQKPDLAKLSADLPSGWQAYWDESTKKAYYGNTVTSETSWTRPTSNT